MIDSLLGKKKRTIISCTVIEIKSLTFFCLNSRLFCCCSFYPTNWHQQVLEKAMKQRSAHCFVSFGVKEWKLFYFLYPRFSILYPFLETVTLYLLVKSWRNNKSVDLNSINHKLMWKHFYANQLKKLIFWSRNVVT